MSEIDFNTFTIDDARELDFFERVKILNARMEWLNDERQKDRRVIKNEENRIKRFEKKYGLKG